MVSVLTEGLVRRGVEVTLFATKDSLTQAELRGVCRSGYEEDKSIIPKVWECLHIAEVFEQAREFDLITTISIFCRSAIPPWLKHRF